MLKYLGIALIAMAIAIAIIPIYTDCQSRGLQITLPNGNTTPMKCHWTGVAELSLAVPLVGVGAMIAVSQPQKGDSHLPERYGYSYSSHDAGITQWPDRGLCITDPYLCYFNETGFNRPGFSRSAGKCYRACPGKKI